MGQVKIYGLETRLNPLKVTLSEAVHSCMVEAFRLPPDKKFHRFFPMEKENFMFPEGRSDRYTIIEISMFEGRSPQAKKRLIELLFRRVFEAAGIEPNDLEITIFETPKTDWGIRGLPADELRLNYEVDV
ncbi:tautomerase family protein [Saccharibacillus alkalitolerans]|uniref:Tautomerase family protein n=1 Tax=Saccharibacillus alkalitolerans TaxID=2705290 RepID=A0ABX0F1P9_9BACL|nr:tautomerase family protein [Saccharibacillus alkalitolerans]NGZ74380.1 tautomerase family protein [Saccharibacillus alkalitolerans]